MLSEGNILDRLYAAEAKLASRERELQAATAQFEEYRRAIKSQFYDVLEDASATWVVVLD